MFEIRGGGNAFKLCSKGKGKGKKSYLAILPLGHRDCSPLSALPDAAISIHLCLGLAHGGFVVAVFLKKK